MINESSRPWRPLASAKAVKSDSGAAISSTQSWPAAGRREAITTKRVSPMLMVRLP